MQQRIGIQAPAERIWDLIADLDSWDRWNPVERDVEGAIAFGGQIAFTETIDGLPQRRAATRIGEWQPNAQLVLMEGRGLWFKAMRFFEIEELEPGNCIFATGIIFSGLRGELFYDKHKGALRQAMEAVTQGMKVAAEA